MAGFGRDGKEPLVTIGIPLYLIFLLLRWVFRKTRRPRIAQVEEGKK